MLTAKDSAIKINKIAKLSEAFMMFSQYWLGISKDLPHKFNLLFYKTREYCPCTMYTGKN